MKATQMTQSIFATATVLLCAAVISSCGASKESKRAAQTTAGPVGPTGEPSVHPTPSPTVAVPAATPISGAPLGPVDQTATTGTEAGQGAPLGPPADTDDENQTGEHTTKPVAKNSVPDFSEETAVKTGGQVGDLSYTSASDDGVMEHFRAVAKTVDKDQQEKNLNLAQLITGARLKKNGSGYSLDLTTNESGEAKIYKLKATIEGNKMKLSSVSAAGDLEFQGGFVKCLDAACDSAYAKIKFSGAYTRVIFRTMSMNNHFNIQESVQDAGMDVWKSYIQNTIQGAASNAQIEAVKASSYEILNGKAAMGIQLTTRDNEAVVLNTLLVAPETGTAVEQKITKVTDLSMNYNLAATAGKATQLSSKIVETHLVNNNGKGQLKVKLSFASGSIDMVLFQLKTKSMSVEEIKKFESTVADF